MKRSYTILYMDDDSDDLEIISDAFLRYTNELKVLHARNGLEGIEQLQKMKEAQRMPCLIIMDINMPVMDGKKALQKIRQSEEFPEIPIVIFSTSNRQEDKDFAREWGADFITKPNSYKNLETLVGEFVKRCVFGSELKA
jgi:CheY-like chemotaxis protein